MRLSCTASVDPRDPTRGRSEPNRCWTTINIGEATSDVMSPLCWSLWTPLSEIAVRRAWHELGLLPTSLVRLPDDPNQFVMSPFFGRQALNVDLLATLLGAMPGASRQSVERSLLGLTRENPPADRAPRWRAPFILIRMPAAMARQSGAVAQLHAEYLAWWQREVFDGEARSGRNLLDDSQRRFETAIRLHARSRFLMQAVHGAVEKMAADAGAADLTNKLFSGFGGVSELSMADDLWSLSRGHLTERDFLRRHGFHGRDQGNVTGVPWRINPQPVREIVRSMARRTDHETARLRQESAAQLRVQATAQLLAALPRSRRPIARMLIKLAAQRTRDTEKSKAAYGLAIDGVRAAADIVGHELARRGVLTGPEDAPFLTLPELLGGLPDDAAGLAAARRAKRDEYRELTLPDTFIGFPEPIATGGADESPSDLLSGAPGSAGLYEGIARVAREIDDSAALEDGEILVCHHTDPAWVSAMSLADALVIDIGATTSHGAIIARELGIPCVIGTRNGTAVIKTGDRVRVDGDRGLVEILR